MKNRFSKSKKNIGVFSEIIIPICIFFLVFSLFYYGVTSVTNTTNSEQLKNVQQAITQSAVHCYATEGFYPDSLEYLEQNYALTIDYNKYIVDYRIFASNIMPDITVIAK